MPARVMLS